VIRTHVTPHAHFSRDGLDLRLRLPITLSEAYLGASIRVPTPSGAVQMKIPPRTQQGAELRLKGKGVKRGDAQGDLYVRLEVRLPTADDPALAAAIASTEQFYASPYSTGTKPFTWSSNARVFSPTMRTPSTRTTSSSLG